MKNVATLILSIMIVLSFNACGDDSSENSTEDENSTNISDINSSETSIEDISDNKSVSLYFSDFLASGESIVQPYDDWYLSIDKEQTKLNEIYANGGSIKKIIKLNAVASSKQFWIFTENNQ